jgi:3',5'-cyclic AMP phosphodiesterase CpdA
MRLIHLSDLHLGFRAFPATERGWNLRERDMASVFQRALQEAARLAPDLLLLTGDIFHRPDPPSTAFLSLARGVRTFQSLRPSVPVLAIAGERDTASNPADPGPVAVLDALPGVDAAAGAARAVRFRDQGLHALLVPHRAARLPPLPELRPDAEARWNVLLLRGRPDLEPGGVSVDPDEWDYIALGGGHEAESHRPHVWTAGSLERVGWDPWSEGVQEKGFVVFDLDAGEGEFHPVPARPVVDLAPVRANPDGIDDTTRRLRHLLEGIPGGIGGKILKVRMEGAVLVPEEGVDPGLLEGLRRRAAHVQIELSGGGDAHGAVGSGGPGDGPQEDATWIPVLPEELMPSGASTGLDPGLHLFTAPDGGLLDQVTDRLAREVPSRPGGGTASPPDPVLWRGGEPADLMDAARRLLEPERAEAEPGPAQGRTAEPAAGLVDAPTRVARLEAELRSLRGDVIEADGEVEARTLEWARDRQEAETRLQSYRDRARELRRRIRAAEEEGATCPTCGRELEDRGSVLSEALREEWEMVVQDGRWWRRRREQLEDRPEDLRELESEALRLRSRAEELVEELERARLGASSGTETQAGADRVVDGTRPRRPRSPQLDSLLRQAGSNLRLWSEGRLSGLKGGEAGRPVVVEQGMERPYSPEEAPGVALCLHLALWREARNLGRELPAGLLVSGLDERGLDPLLPLLQELPIANLRILIALPPGAPVPGLTTVRSLLQAERRGHRVVLRSVATGPASVRLGGR